MECGGRSKRGVRAMGATLKARGYTVEVLEGNYYTAEDVGTSSRDMTVIAERTKYVTGLPRPLVTLGTDGYGRSESRSGLREFFEVDARWVIVATLTALARDGKLDPAVVQDAMKVLNVNPEKVNPAVS